MSSHPIIHNKSNDDIFAVYAAKPITVKEFLSDVARLEQHLPETQYVINLCKNPYLFMVLFAASIKKKIITLFPSNTAKQNIESLKALYSECVALSDEDVEGFKNELDSTDIQAENFLIELKQTICVFFTSGSTGEPKPYEKTWGQLVKRTLDVSMILPIEDKTNLISTVPTQHLYGFEHFVMFGLQTKAQLIIRNIFFPEDLNHVLQETRSNSYIISTPYHLQCFTRSNCDFTSIKGILSSTAPLDTNVAIKSEEKFSCRLMEVYGCTELGAVATRRTSETPIWQLVPGLKLEQVIEGYAVSSDDIDKAIILQDELEKLNEQQFKVLGRKADNLNVAGKRMSAKDLNLKITSIEGVEDVHCYLPNYLDGVSRIIAFIVTQQPIDRIKTELRKCIDPVFIPKYFISLSKLPRNKVGKIPKQQLDKIVINEMKPSFKFIVPQSHPAIPGHFPNNPVVPGAVILDYVIESYKKVKPEFELTELKQIKFKEKLLPDQEAMVKFVIKETGVQFKVYVKDVIISQGAFQ